MKPPRSEGKLEGVTLLRPAAAKECVAKKKVGHKDRGCVSLDPNKFYLDKDDTYHSMFGTWCLKNIRKLNTFLRGGCNAGVTTSTRKGMLSLFDMCINEKGIADLLSIPQLEDYGYRVTCDTLTNWIVHTPQGKQIMFKRDKGICNRMPYVKVKTFQEKLALINPDEHLTKNIEMVRKNFEGWKKKEIQDAVSAREAQSMISHPPDEQLEQLVSSQSLKIPCKSK